MTHFSTLALDGKLLSALEGLGYKEATPVQERAIPQILAQKDILVSAQTGTGKTAAFLLPALHLISKGKKEKWRGPKMLVLVPTRELAMQVAKEAEKFSKHLSRVKTVCIYGGVPYPVQRRQLSKPYEVLVATPGRLIDFINQGKINLKGVETLVLDEADRMLDMGFLDPVREICSHTSPDRQTHLFSATWDKRIMGISAELQNDPQQIAIKAKSSAPKNIHERLFMADGMRHKIALLDHLLEATDYNQMIIFTSTIRQAESLSEELLDKGHSAAALHGNMNQRQRTRAIEKMRKGNVRVMVATDVAARGIDILTISHVINFDLPMQAEDYVHRIGRTGRAGKKGEAISFAGVRESHLLKAIAERTGKKPEAEVIAGLEPKLKAAPKKPGMRHGKKPGMRQGKKTFHRKKRFQKSRV